MKQLKVAFIGSVGIPNRYGGFESFLEQCAPILANSVAQVTVSCDAEKYDDHTPEYKGVRRIFINVPANGAKSVLHDLVAFMRVWPNASHIVVLGVSGGLWFPLFRFLCLLTGAQLCINIDGVEWRREKFSYVKRIALRLFDGLAQLFAHRIVYDNECLRPYVLESCQDKAVLIAYSGDHVLRLDPPPPLIPLSAMTVCRIEPENQIELLIEGVLRSNLERYTIVGNWQHSVYGRNIIARFGMQSKLKLLDSIYDQAALAHLRQSHLLYLHGHSVGGTNPSLVEMLFYDAQILCFDCVFNRATAGDHANYFANATELTKLIDLAINKPRPPRRQPPEQYRAEEISRRYLNMLQGCDTPQSGRRNTPI